MVPVLLLVVPVLVVSCLLLLCARLVLGVLTHNKEEGPRDQDQVPAGAAGDTAEVAAPGPSTASSGGVGQVQEAAAEQTTVGDTDIGVEDGFQFSKSMRRGRGGLYFEEYLV